LKSADLAGHEADLLSKISQRCQRLEGQAGCGACHGVPSLSMALRMTSSLRMAAVSASFLGYAGGDQA
jgi:hypothetical protein